MLKKFILKTKNSHYPIFVGTQCLNNVVKNLNLSDYSSIVLFYDKKLTKKSLSIYKLLSEQKTVHKISLNGGEELKAIHKLYPLFSKIIKWGCDRKCLFIALGGGSVGDAVGFMASVYLRGVDWIGVPTTLLSQVDSSVGGKTAINHELGKNLIGTFYQPKAVICDTSFLHSLPKREFYSGLAEVYKYGLSLDKAIYTHIGNFSGPIFNRVDQQLSELIYLSVICKAKVVSKDEKEAKGIREILNFGHTLAHALENYWGGHKIKHGEAVLIGMLYESLLSHKLGLINQATCQKAIQFLRPLITKSFNLKDVSFSSLYKRMLLDKKNTKHQICFITLIALHKGQTYFTSDKLTLTAVYKDLKRVLYET